MGEPKKEGAISDGPGAGGSRIFEVFAKVARDDIAAPLAGTFDHAAGTNVGVAFGLREPRFAVTDGAGAHGAPKGPGFVAAGTIVDIEHPTPNATTINYLDEHGQKQTVNLKESPGKDDVAVGDYLGDFKPGTKFALGIDKSGDALGVLNKSTNTGFMLDKDGDKPALTGEQVEALGRAPSRQAFQPRFEVTDGVDGHNAPKGPGFVAQGTILNIEHATPNATTINYLDEHGQKQAVNLKESPRKDDAAVGDYLGDLKPGTKFALGIDKSGDALGILNKSTNTGFMLGKDGEKPALTGEQVEALGRAPSRQTFQPRFEVTAGAEGHGAPKGPGFVAQGTIVSIEHPKPGATTIDYLDEHGQKQAVNLKEHPGKNDVAAGDYLGDLKPGTKFALGIDKSGEGLGILNKSTNTGFMLGKDGEKPALTPHQVEALGRAPSRQTFAAHSEAAAPEAAARAVPKPGDFVVIDGVPKSANAPFTQIGRNAKVSHDEKNGVTTIIYDDLRGAGKQHTMSFRDPMVDHDGAPMVGPNQEPVRHPLGDVARAVENPNHHVEKMRVDFDGKGNSVDGPGNVNYLLTQKDNAIPLTGHVGEAPARDWGEANHDRSPSMAM